MSEDALTTRGRALEESFFAKENEKLRLALREKTARAAARENLAAVSGITDDAVLDRLMGLGVGADTLVSLSLVPLVEVAWADEEIDEKERGAILAAADETGLSGDGLALLGHWLRARPDPGMRAAWRAYVEALCRDLPPDGRRALEADLVGRARAVAEAAGGFLGVGKVSAAEQAVLDDLAGAFR